MKTRSFTTGLPYVYLRMFFVSILIIGLTNQSYAGDLKFTGKLNFSSHIFRGKAFVFKAEVENTELYPAYNLDFTVEVINLATEQLLFSSFTQTATFSAQSITFLTTGS